MSDTDPAFEVVELARSLQVIVEALQGETDFTLTVRRTVPSVVAGEAKIVVTQMGWEVLTETPLDDSVMFTLVREFGG